MRLSTRQEHPGLLLQYLTIEVDGLLPVGRIAMGCSVRVLTPVTMAGLSIYGTLDRVHARNNLAKGSEAGHECRTKTTHIIIPCSIERKRGTSRE